MQNRIEKTAGSSRVLTGAERSADFYVPDGSPEDWPTPSVNGDTEAAIRDIVHGYPIVPLNGKRPIRKGWQEDPIRSAFAWEELDHDGNHGIALDPADRVLVVDVDVKNGKQGPDTLRRWRDATGLDLSPYPCQRTPSGGLHFVGRIPEDYPAEKLPNGDAGDGVETLRSRKQFVRAPGRTPAGEYEEVRPLPPLELLPAWPAEFLDHIASAKNSGASTPPRSQEELRAPSVDWVQEAVRKIENDDRFETRDAWLKVGAAIRAAVGPENVEEGHRIFQEFSRRWEGGAYDPDATERTYRTLAPPYEVGFQYLAELAGDRVAVAQATFEADKSMDVPEPSEEQETNLVARYAEPLEEIEYSGPPGFLVDRLILASDINFIAGDGGSMKTTGALAIAAAVASGSPVFGHEVPERPRRVLYVSEEDDKDQLKNKADAIAAGCGFEIPAGHLEILAQRGFTFGHERWRKDMREHVRDGGYGLVVFDPLIEMQEGKENSNDDARPVIKFLRSITARRGPAVIVVHHAGKGSEGKSKIDRYMRGASAYKNGARSVLGFKKTGDGFLIDPLAMRRVKTPEPTAVRVEIETDPEDEHGIRWKTASFEGAPRWKVEREAAEEDIKTLLNVEGTLNSGELRKAVVGAGHKPPVYSKARRSLERRGEIEYEPGDHGAKLWHLATPEEAFTAESEGEQDKGD